MLRKGHFLRCSHKIGFAPLALRGFLESRTLEFIIPESDVLSMCSPRPEGEGLGVRVVIKTLTRNPLRERGWG